MAVLGLRFLDKAEEDVVHAASLECLETVGLLVHSGRTRHMLEAAGALPGDRKELVTFPESMVLDAVHTAPKCFVLGARDSRHDLHVPVTGAPYVSTGGVTLSIMDPESGVPRLATTKDLADIARLADALDPIDAVWPLVTTSDVPAHAQFANELWVCLNHTTKHVLGSAGSGTLGVADAKLQIELGALATGGTEELRKHPLFSVLSCPIAPLSFETGAVEAQVDYARAGIPVIGMSMAMGGMTAPVTLAGTIVTLNAEALASLVITQTAAPGAPHIYCSEATMADMASGYIGYRGPEAPMIFAAAAQMARRYGLPKMTGILGVDAPKPGVGVPFGELATLMLTAMSGTDLCSGIGGLDLDAGCSLEQMVIDAVQWEDYRAFLRNFAVDEKTAALDVIREVGPGGSFLNQAHTAKNFRSQLYFRSKKAAVYGATMSDRMVPDARDVVRKTLREHSVEPLDRDVRRRGDEMLKEYARTPTPTL
ncbi:MAG TPA: trimethylamine methyltransferase family protein [Thermoplasmata archaeon]|nr:trimethylamine methyltransferase family protein [Thermoplasmata archaeon]